METGALPRAGTLHTVRLVVEGMRPRQWVKNAFVFGGVLYSGQFVEAGPLATAAAVFVAFCLASGAAYLINDAVDAEADRLNPRTAGAADRAWRAVAADRRGGRCAGGRGGARHHRARELGDARHDGRVHRAPGGVLDVPEAPALHRRDGGRGRLRPARVRGPRGDRRGDLRVAAALHRAARAVPRLRQAPRRGRGARRQRASAAAGARAVLRGARGRADRGGHALDHRRLLALRRARGARPRRCCSRCRS